MALQRPFVSWDFERYPRHLTQHGAFYYVITPGGLRTHVGRSVDRSTGHLVYRREHTFVQAYRDQFPLGDVDEWDRCSDFTRWIESVMYYSFVHTSIAGIANRYPRILHLPILHLRASFFPFNSLRPITISLWNQFSDIEAKAMANLPGTFPIAIGLHLRIASDYGIGLDTHNSTIFILNPPTTQAAALQAWCLANSKKIRALPLNSINQLPTIESAPPTPDEIINIIDLPTSVDKPEMRSIEAVIRVADLNHKFYYLACSLCNQSTTAYDDNEFFCNYYSQRVHALPKIKFKIKLSDLTDSIDAIVFSTVSEQYYGITGKDIDYFAMHGSLPLPLPEKLSQPRDCTVRLRAEMSDYGGINQCKFIVQGIFDKTEVHHSAGSKHPLGLEPPTPQKKKPKATTPQHKLQLSTQLANVQTQTLT